FQLDEKDQYPLFGRTVPSDVYNVMPILEYFQDTLQITHLAVLTMNEAFGQSFGQAVQLATSLLASQAVEEALQQGNVDGDGVPLPSTQIIRIHRINMDASPAGVSRALRELKQTKYRYVLAAVLTRELNRELLLQAVDMNLAGNGEHQWFYPHSFDLEDTTDIFVTAGTNSTKDGEEEEEEESMDSKLIRAYQGIGVFVPSAEKSDDNIAQPNDRYKRFQEQMSQIQNAVDIAYLNSILPQSATFEDIEETDDETGDIETEDTDSDPEVGAENETERNEKDDKGDDEDKPVVTGRSGVGSSSAGVDRNPLAGERPGPKNPSNPTLGGFGDRFTETFLKSFPYLHDEDFLNPVQHDNAAFMYDATILMGLSACQAIAQKQYGQAFTGHEQYDFLRQTSFEGVTGKVTIDPATGSRTFDSTTYDLINFVAEEFQDENGTLVTRFDAVVTDVYQDMIWKPLEEFIVNDGTS
ncbi:MAG: hypothetical protein SGILL_009686, partial [Bacillariaceae sp.]